MHAPSAAAIAAGVGFACAERFPGATALAGLVEARFATREAALEAALDGLRGVDRGVGRLSVVLAVDAPDGVDVAWAWRALLGHDREIVAERVEAFGTAAFFEGLALPSGVGSWRVPPAPHSHAPALYQLGDYR